MPTDHLFFVHGVRTQQDNYAQVLAENLKQILSMGPDARTVHAYELEYHQTVEQLEQKVVLTPFENSPVWQKFWYRDLRSSLIIPFAGDAVLYFNSEMGAKIIAPIRNTLQTILDASQAGDSLHLIGHSLGSVILFDILFGPRWTTAQGNERPAGYEDVDYIRNHIQGLGAPNEQGIQLGSITMGSPIAIFGLMETRLPSGLPDPNVIEIFKKIVRVNVFPWLNLYHPADPIAFPLSPIVSILLGNAEVKGPLDQPVPPANWWQQLINWIMSFLPLIQIGYGAYAHGTCYFEDNKQLAATIASFIVDPSKVG
jgi:hypothetical protein